MKILVTGGRGQLGRALSRRGLAQGHTVAAPDVDELDICDVASVASGIAESAPAIVINAAAYTAVDKAESERDDAFRINRDGARVLARMCKQAGVPLLHVSTDYVFDGAASTPYRESDAIAPQGVYASSKAEGETAVLGAGGSVVRTSWLFEVKGPSFVHTMLRLAKDRPQLRVVADQRGCPTWADDLADGLLMLSAKAEPGAIYHYCNEGETTWHAFATEIIELGRRHTALACERIDAITTAEYPTPAKRPQYSVLDTHKVRSLGITPPSWRPGLAHVVGEILRQE